MRLESVTSAASRDSAQGSQPRRLFSAALSVLLLGCGGLPATPGTAVAHVTGEAHVHSPKAAVTPPDAPKTTDRDRAADAQLMYELMVAELAGRRGQLGVATEGYLRASEHTDDVRVAKRAAQLALFANRWKDAEQASRRWLALKPEAVAAYELLGQALMQQSRIDEAAQAFDKLVERSPGSSEKVLSDVANLLMQQPTDSAIGVLQALRTTHPRTVALPLGVARLEMQRSNGTKALRAADEALQLDANNPDAQLLRAQVLVAEGRVAEGLEGVEKAVERDAGNVPLRLGYARLLVEAGRYEVARPELEQLFESASEEPTVLLTIGLLALDARRLDDSARYLERLLQTGEFDDQAHYYLGQIADEKQNLNEAIGHYESVMPGDLYINAQVRVAELLAVTGKLSSGLERIREMSVQVADDPAIQPRLLSAEARMLQEGERPAEAVGVLSDGLAKFPDNEDLRYARALAAEAAGDEAMMEKDLKSLIESDPDNAHALNALGYHLVNSDKRLDEAEGYLEKAVNLMPEDPAILDSLGWLRYRQGRLKQSLVLLRKAYGKFPDAEIAAHLGEVLWMSGNEEAAQRLWTEALVDAPDDDLLNKVVERFTQ